MDENGQANGTEGTRSFARRIAGLLYAKMTAAPTTPTGYDQALGCIAWPAGYAAGMADARGVIASEAPRPNGDVTFTISRPAAAFLQGTVEHLNQKKLLPEGDRAALQTSAWLEEIEARCSAALEET